MGFPSIPSPFADIPGPLVTYTGLKTTRYHFDYGLNFYETGIATINPPVFPFTTPSYQDDPRNGPIYPSFIPKTDSDGNDIAGVRLGRRDSCLWPPTRAGRCGGKSTPTTAARPPGSSFRSPKTEAERATSRATRGHRSRLATPASPPTTPRCGARSTTWFLTACCCAKTPVTEEARLMQAGVTRGVPLPPGGSSRQWQLLPACEPRKGGHHHHHQDRDGRQADSRPNEGRLPPPPPPPLPLPFLSPSPPY